ncbi:MAG: nucleotidyltransferase family protein [Phycisphaerae bacterium]|nr:nucleotidyltransferase family protein [Phycisphaerae bacterium]
MKTGRDILNELNKHADFFHKSFSVCKIGLFGSFANGTERQASDIDILVELAEPTFDNHMDLKFYLEKLFDRSVDLVLTDTVKKRLRPIIEQEVVYAHQHNLTA